MLNVKRACPSADKNNSELIFVKSGLNMYSNPTLAFGNDKENIINPIRITANKGISILFASSIPFFTPLAVKNMHIDKNVNVDMHAGIVFCVNIEKYSEKLLIFIFAKLMKI